MKNTIVLAVLVLTITACAGIQAPAPTMPQFATEDGKACARSCQAMYVDANQSCSLMVGGARTAAQREQCFNSSNQMLAECYSTCE